MSAENQAIPACPVQVNSEGASCDRQTLHWILLLPVTNEHFKKWPDIPCTALPGLLPGFRG